MESRNGLRGLPKSLNAYSTWGGTSGYAFEIKGNTLALKTDTPEDVYIVIN